MCIREKDDNLSKEGVKWKRTSSELTIHFEDNALVRWSIRRLGVDPSETLGGYVIASVVFGALAAFLRAPSWFLSAASMFPIILMYAARSSRVEIEITPENIVRRTFHDMRGKFEESLIHDGTCDIQVGSRAFGRVIRLETSGGEVQIESDSHSEALKLKRVIEDFFEMLEQ